MDGFVDLAPLLAEPDGDRPAAYAEAALAPHSPAEPAWFLRTGEKPRERWAHTRDTPRVPESALGACGDSSALRPRREALR
ncbi:hypothetical protein SAMN04244553_1891 [Nocardia amikacinitolerans]|uniref:Uncharacterized protein n=1 Tax=Nocardia amikacinitolerans TaxID=756689 RepID=A0A285L5S9_9NOCA|nr:hypothetical protein [Nocardia amikacinitolerans]SNY80234.1 hypothetical protein SAMN04244553_1891 [Nocardia amikacinitolerans]